ncbi:hypothetical protein SLEP1_g46741 [Rubroshorea leprosula]|uniref:TF-B3 domain-containing protein n=1 Tax=Rubroshorea leprosula TaxID=152421 RepID=A0AAV5LNY3_9ROSI|nr:hypothetical protein SLEP1_g46741 [Rubroshorea leprosula]
MEPTQNAHSHIPQIPNETSAAEWASHFHHQHSWQQFYPPSVVLSQHNPSLGFNLNQENDEEVDNQPAATDNSGNANQDVEKEPMFEKPLTPSDVGKLNRLVIPKQYAEKYFPLGGDSGDKGLLLSFEDESGKCWRFRYSYWNSSQSYVLTKGWSRYVKEKQLDAGDVILFERHRTDGDRLFIGWRRRGSAAANQDGGAAVSGGGNDGWSRGLYQGHPYLEHIQGKGTNVPYQPDCSHAEAAVQSQTTTGSSKRRLRLFGVNMECELDESEPSTPDGSSMSSQGPAYQQFYSHSHPYSDITFSQDMNQMRNRRG